MSLRDLPIALLITSLGVGGGIGPRAVSAAEDRFLCVDEAKNLRPEPTPEEDQIDWVQSAPRPQLPRRPIAPPQLVRERTTRPFGCNRQYVLNNNSYSLDSFHRQDAERLRPVLQGIPAAIAELDEYQENQNHARFAAYTGTLGLLTALGAVIAASVVDDTDQARVIRIYGVTGGLALAGGSFVISYGILKANDSHLDRAVEEYNKARPGKELKLQLSTGLLF